MVETDKVDQTTANSVNLGALDASGDAAVLGEPLDPNEIRTALDGLRELMARIGSAAIRRDLRAAYIRIANITVTERLV